MIKKKKKITRPLPNKPMKPFLENWYVSADKQQIILNRVKIHEEGNNVGKEFITESRYFTRMIEVLAFLFERGLKDNISKKERIKIEDLQTTIQEIMEKLDSYLEN